MKKQLLSTISHANNASQFNLLSKRMAAQFGGGVGGSGTSGGHQGPGGGSGTINTKAKKFCTQGEEFFGCLKALGYQPPKHQQHEHFEDLFQDEDDKGNSFAKKLMLTLKIQNCLSAEEIERLAPFNQLFGVFGPKPSTFDELDEKWLRDRRSNRNPEFAPTIFSLQRGGLRKKPSSSSSGASSHRQPIPATFTSSSYSGGNKYGNFVKSKDLSMPSSSLPATPVVIEPPPKPFLSPQNFWKQPKLNHPPPQKPIPIQDEMPAPIPETSEEFDRGRGTEIAPPATFSYYHGDVRPKYQGRKIPFSDPDKVLDAVDAGLKALREQFETKKKTESSSSKDPREFQQFPSY